MSNIEWTDTTWNPVVGCTPVSPGCLNCYAATMARRLEAMGRPEYQPREWWWPPSSNPDGTAAEPARLDKVTRIAEVHGGRAVFTGDVRTVPDRLADPLRWRKPRRVFVNSMSDLFHESVPFEFIDRVFAVMALCPQHTFQVLTKRPERMAEYLSRPWVNMADGRRGLRDSINDAAFKLAGRYAFPTQSHGMLAHPGWPLPNVWLGTSVEDQARADERIPHLLRCPAAVRFLSCEPLLGAVKPQLIQWDPTYGDEVRSKIGWIILGGESGPSARPCDVAWIRSIVRQCAEAGVACFVKQLGRRPIVPTDEPWAVLDRKGADPAEWPEDLRVRQFPEVRP